MKLKSVTQLMWENSAKRDQRKDLLNIKSLKRRLGSEWRHTEAEVLMKAKCTHFLLTGVKWKVFKLIFVSADTAFIPQCCSNLEHFLFHWFTAFIQSSSCDLIWWLTDSEPGWPGSRTTDIELIFLAILTVWLWGCQCYHSSPDWMRFMFVILSEM